MVTKSFDSVAQRAKKDWSPEATAVYEAASASYREEMATLADIGKELVAARKARNLSQGALASMTGIQQSEISRIERGQGNPTLTTLGRLARQLGLRFSLRS